MARRNLQEDNPCLKEQEMTYKCFNQNNFNKEACFLQVQNYKTCKGFWNSVRTQRRVKGIHPTLPPPDEREQIKRDYFSQKS